MDYLCPQSAFAGPGRIGLGKALLGMTSPLALSKRARACLALAVIGTALFAMSVFGTNVDAAPDCNNPYYYTAPECQPGGSTKPAPASVSISIASRCRSRNFMLRPQYAGQPVTSSKLYRNGRKYIFDLDAPFSFRIQVRSLRKGSTSRFRLVTTFTSGEVIANTFKVKRCGRPFKRS